MRPTGGSLRGTREHKLETTRSSTIGADLLQGVVTAVSNPQSSRASSVALARSHPLTPPEKTTPGIKGPQQRVRDCISRGHRRDRRQLRHLHVTLSFDRLSAKRPPPALGSRLRVPSRSTIACRSWPRNAIRCSVNELPRTRSCPGSRRQHRTRRRCARCAPPGYGRRRRVSPAGRTRSPRPLCLRPPIVGFPSEYAG